MKKILKTLITLLGFVAALISLYKFILDQNKFDLSYEIITNSDVIEVKSQISDLHISYAGVDLLKENKKLQIIQVRIINTGNETILSNYYDDNNPIGIEINNAQIIEKPIILKASNKYLKNDQKVIVESGNKILFSKIIIEPNEFFDIKILLVADKGILPQIKAIGKLAGINAINVFDAQNVDKDSLEYIFNNLSFWDFISYLIFFGTLFFFLTTMPKLFFGKYKSKLNPEIEAILNEFIESVPNPEDYKDFIRIYKTGSILHLNSMNILSNDLEELNNKFNVYRKIKKEGPSSPHFKQHWHLMISNIYNKNMLGRMLELGLVENQDGTLVLNAEKKNSLNIFLKFIEDKGSMKKVFRSDFQEEFDKYAEFLK